MKKLGIALMIVSIVFSAVLLSCEGRNRGDTNTIRIGAIYPLSGPVAAIGHNIVRGIEFAVDEINANGGIDGRMIEVIFADSEGRPAQGMTVAERLITRDNVVAIIGAYQSAVTEVVSQVAERHRVPLITAISTADQLTTRGFQYFFRLSPTNSIFLRSMIEYLVTIDRETSTNIRTISILADNTLMGQETARWARHWAGEHGIEVLAEVLHIQGSADLSSEVLTIMNSGADALVVDSYISDAILITRTMAEQGFTPPVMVAKATGFIDPTFLPNTGTMANGISSAVEWSADMYRGQGVNAGFRERFGIDMNGHSAQAYTAVWVLKTAIVNAGSTDSSAIRYALRNIRIEGYFPGGNEIILPYDVISFEDVVWHGMTHTNTNANAVVTVAQIQDGVMRTVWPFAYTPNRPVVPAPFR